MKNENILKYKELIFPSLGLKCKGKVVKCCYSNLLISIFEIENTKTVVSYKGIIKYDETIKLGDILECMIVSYSDNGINCILL